MIIWGAILSVAPPMIGLGWTTIGMVKAFHDLGNNGISDPNALAFHIGSVLHGVAIGMFIAPLGLMLLIAGVVMHLTRSREQNPKPGVV